MTNDEISVFVHRLNKGLDLAEERMLEEKAKYNKDIVVSSEEHGVTHIPAEELLNSEDYSIKREEEQSRMLSFIKKLGHIIPKMRH